MTTAVAYWTQSELAKMGFASVGKHVFLSKSATFDHPEHIHLGDRVRIDAYSCLIASQPIRIGSNVHFGTSVTINAAAEVSIGDYSGISAGTKIFTSDDDYGGDYLTGPTVDPELTRITVAHVTLGQHCIVGANSVILPGAVLNDGVAVGALSLVKGELEEWTICGGIPARILKKRSKSLLDKLNIREATA